jgi:hypothetical protein
MKTPETNNNGMKVEDMWTYDDLLEELEYDREWTINLLTESRVEESLKHEDIVTLLMTFNNLNNIQKSSEYYLRDDQELVNEFTKGIHEVYSNKTNEEIVEWYRENEPYVFGMQNELERMFAL